MTRRAARRADRQHASVPARPRARLERDRRQAADRPARPRRRPRTRRRWPGIVAGRGGPRGLHGVAPAASLVPIQVLEMQQGALMGTTATLLAGHRPRARPERRRQSLRPRRRDPGSARGAVRRLRRVGRDGRRRGRRASSAPCWSRRPATTAPTGGRFGTIASPAASPGWLAVGASDGRTDAADASTSRSAPTASRRASTPCRCWARCRPRATRRCRSCCRPAPRSPTARARRPTSSPGTDEGDFRATDGTSLVSGKAVLLPRDGAPIAQRAAAAGAAGASALVLYGDGGAPAGASGSTIA